MKTDDLIRSLAADTPPRAASPDRLFQVALAAAVLVAAALFFATLGPRTDIGQAAQSVRFLFKFAVTGALAAAAFHLVRRQARPGAGTGGAARMLGLVPVLLAAGVALELAAVPPGDWAARLVGTNAAVCLTFIPLIGAAPLALFLLALRAGAPTRPAAAGAVAGLVAGGIAAAFYAAHCTDDSPLFVATWYGLAIMGLTVAGALGGRLFARW
ncbi:NrsF family protein [Arenibaculum sp.]|jgi:hypothetical protein|uniref:NrsF family protein n=1 Tax=Arenibaculum sp. TaxID=2865862 RepID=UPI002E1496B3|nr:NrsF family protein [Arenibaculum sp.]